MTTFGGISKTSSMQITFNWRLSFVWYIVKKRIIICQE
jgi:hypothetical protein